MIANILPDSKVKALSKVKVVHPKWILDSLKEGKLLRCTEYLTYSRVKDQKPISWNTSDEKTVCSRDQAASSSFMTHSPYISTAFSTDGTSQTCKNDDAAVGVDVNSYYSRSRLHFISTMKMELREYVSELKKKKISSFPGLEKLRNSKGYTKQKDKIILYFSLNFRASCYLLPRKFNNMMIFQSNPFN